MRSWAWWVTLVVGTATVSAVEEIVLVHCVSTATATTAGWSSPGDAHGRMHLGVLVLGLLVVVTPELFIVNGSFLRGFELTLQQKQHPIIDDVVDTVYVLLKKEVHNLKQMIQLVVELFDVGLVACS